MRTQEQQETLERLLRKEIARLKKQNQELMAVVKESIKDAAYWKRASKEPKGITNGE